MKIMIILFLINLSILYSQTIPSNFKTDIDIRDIELENILSGGPGKDGIPAIDNPKFLRISEANTRNDDLGILIEEEGLTKFYPYRILVWHEIVNDKFNSKHIAVTFCPLCGSAIAFNRNFNNKVHRFGVSGLLYESNLLMYDDITETLWSQSTGRAVVGEYTGKQLELINSSIMEFSEVKKHYKNALILSDNTGYSRNYNIYPYGNYDNNKDIYFPISKRDSRFPLKEIMIAFRYNGTSYAIPRVGVTKGRTTYNANGIDFEIKEEKGRYEIFTNNIGIKTYYEMWFSWVIHNGDKGFVLK